LVRRVRRSILGDRWLAAGRNAATENGWVAAASRRPAGPASAAGSRGPGRLLSLWPYGRHRGVHASWTGVRAAAVWRDDRRLAQAGSGPPALRPRRRGYSSCHRWRQARIVARQRPSGTGMVGRDTALRTSWAPTTVMTAPMRMSSSGSPGEAGRC